MAVIGFDTLATWGQFANHLCVWASVHYGSASFAIVNLRSLAIEQDPAVTAMLRTYGQIIIPAWLIVSASACCTLFCLATDDPDVREVLASAMFFVLSVTWAWSAARWPSGA